MIDVVIIGGGPAGLAAALGAKKGGAGSILNAYIMALVFILSRKSLLDLNMHIAS